MVIVILKMSVTTCTNVEVNKELLQKSNYHINMLLQAVTSDNSITGYILLELKEYLSKPKEGSKVSGNKCLYLK
jgi:hypothetical protein